MKLPSPYRNKCRPCLSSVHAAFAEEIPAGFPATLFQSWPLAIGSTLVETGAAEVAAVSRCRPSGSLNRGHLKIVAYLGPCRTISHHDASDLTSQVRLVCYGM